MDIDEVIVALMRIREEHGNLPVIVYKNFFEKSDVRAVNPCSNRDHVLIVIEDD